MLGGIGWNDVPREPYSWFLPRLACPAVTLLLVMLAWWASRPVINPRRCERCGYPIGNIPDRVRCPNCGAATRVQTVR